MLSQQLGQALARYLITASIQSIEGGKAILKLDTTGELIAWPIAHLPSYLTPGSVVSFQIGSDTLVQQEREAIARKLLADLIK
ncbi:MAG: hypothetical protein A2V81_03810 [Candidatus Abawacabacteria bacterium RBG_16_42_10]|uniref:DUF3006 domain-containing protein n=1 Tax=Candidatus Abawacabacteria bacterium RBG_16_42_10 TaxID=1817814 RepID=A0A1F4XJU1_9BACT|nr:MAG: hypothetical protein A2V81_03810 [Candidatus Abawacabacteria bacterium RBG_16_42_10]